MITPNPAAARNLEQHASSIATSVRNHFLLAQKDSAQGESTTTGDSWEHHFRQRILELSAAVAAGEPALFTARVLWSRQAMKARAQEARLLGDSLNSLRAVLAANLPAELVNEALACVDDAIDQYRQELPEAQVSQLDPGIPTQRLALLYLQATLEGNVRHAMEIVLDAIDSGLRPEHAITQVLLPSQGEIGHLWHLDHVTIAEEHLVTTTTQRLMAIIVQRAPRAPDRGFTAVAASIAGNPHEIGIRAISYLLELDGWRTIYLGPDVPRDNLPAAIHFFDADIALLSIALSSQLPRLGDTINAIRAKAAENVRIMVGGNAFRDAPDAWRQLGADGFARDADEALKVAASLMVSPTSH